MALIQDICYEAVLKYGSRTAFDSLNNQTTFDRLWERVSYIAGALSDLGLRKGERIGILSDIAVIGLADPAGWGEKVTAVVILKEGYALSLDDVKTRCRNKIAGYKIPKELKVVDIIPRNHSGKIKKLALKEQLSCIF